MIKVSNLNKYYNKGRSNELHVINDVSLELPEKGFVTILGKSGSGKTTLLNVIGGLDDFHDGSIIYEEEKFTKYNMRAIDKYRSKNIGYIFQNYLVMQDETVFENVDTSLKLAGIQDKNERKKRANEALRVVGMSKYRRKAANSLSGGQKQRIGIARAIAKLPKIIIADEPTGNLDSENSVEIMRILKDISQKYLIIMVTHNELLAKAFADRIIYYKDGSIVKDEVNVPTENINDSLQGRVKKIYLSDYKSKSSDINGVKTEVYKSSDKELSLNLKVIEQDGLKYLFVDESVIVNDKGVELLDERPKKVKNKEEEKVSTFDLSSFNEIQRKPVPFHILLKQAFFSFFNEGKFKTTAYKILSGLMGIGISVVSIITYYTFFTTDYSKALDTLELNSLSITSMETGGGIYESLRQADVLNALDNFEESKVKGVVTSVYVNSDSFGLGKLTGIATSYASAYVHAPAMNGENPNVSWGENPTGEREIAVSTGLIDLAMPQYVSRGYKYESLLGKEFYNHDGLRLVSGSTDVTPVVTGIVNSSVPTIYLSREGQYSLYDSFITPAASNTTFSILEKATFLTRDQVGELGDVTSVNLEKYDYEPGKEVINVVISTGAQKYFNKNFATDYKLFNVVGTYENNEVLVVLNNDVDVNVYQSTGGTKAFSMYALSDYVPTNIELTEGSRLPEKHGEYLVSENNKSTHKGIVGHYKVSDDNLNLGNIYTVFSTVYSKSSFANIKPLAADFLGKISYNYLNTYSAAIYSDDFAASEAYLNSAPGHEGGLAYVFKATRTAIDESNLTNLSSSTNIVMIGVSVGVLVLMLVLVLISTRSNMIRHIYTISVFRSLGTTRGDVHRIFISKDLISYLFTIFLGIIVSFAAAWIFAAISSYYAVPFWLFLIVIVLTYGISLLGTMIPLWGLLSKTPNKIASKYDI